jgi:hypothetical protein
MSSTESISTGACDTTTATAAAARVFVAPERPTEIAGKSIFLAGSIDMGTAIDWQASTIEAFKSLPITIFSPRRANMNNEWKQDITFEPFREQVDWELDMLQTADVIMLFFAGGSKSPISLLELGLFANSSKLVVGCPEDFYRRGNVQIVCERFGIELVDSFEALLKAAERKLQA